MRIDLGPFLKDYIQVCCPENILNTFMSLILAMGYSKEEHTLYIAPLLSQGQTIHFIFAVL